MTSAHHCDRCGARIILALTEARKRQPLDWVPDHDGNVAAYCDELGAWHARTLSDKKPPPGRHERVYMPHFATCKKRAASSPAETPSNRVPKREPLPVTDLDAYRQRIKTVTPAKERRRGRRRRRQA